MYVTRTRPVTRVVAHMWCCCGSHAFRIVVMSPPWVWGCPCVVVMLYSSCRSLLKAIMSCGCECVSCNVVMSEFCTVVINV